MHRELLSHPHIASYSAFMLFALAGGYLMARWRAGRVGIPRSHIDNLILLITVASLFGARLFSWLFYFPPGITLWTALTTSSGGMVFYGGLVFGIAAVLLYAGVTKLPLGDLADSCAPSVALGLALGRVGCFLAGCCWGDVCGGEALAQRVAEQHLTWQVRTLPWVSGASFPLAVTFPKEAAAYEQHRELGWIDATAGRSLPVHPVQLYEAGLALALCLLLNRRFRQRAWKGEIALRLAIGYAVIRFSMEFLRADNAPAYAGLTLSQVISIVIAMLALAIIICREQFARRIPRVAEIRTPLT